MNITKEDLKRIKLVIFDLDGVLTDGKITIDHKGETSKSFYSRDWQGITFLLQHKVKIAIITSSGAKAVKHFARKAGLDRDLIFTRIFDKLACYKTIKNRLNVKDQEVLYMGDDVADIKLLENVGISTAPANSHLKVIEIVDIVATNKGGEGAVREICDLIIGAC